MDPDRHGSARTAGVSGLWVYPIKSLEGCGIDRARLGPDGGFVRDRQLALVGPDGEYVNGKRTAAVHRIRTSFDLSAERVTLAPPAASAAPTEDPPGRATFALAAHDELEAWFGDYFGFDITVRAERPSYPDRTTASGPTVVSRATLRTVADWFDLSVENVRRRFRANLEVDDCPAFWEDRLYDDRDHRVVVRVGEATLHGEGPCKRCVVPTRDPDTGEATPSFTERFVERRRASLPDWSRSDRFDGAFRLAVTTIVPPASTDAEIGVGDTVRIDRRVPIEE